MKKIETHNASLDEHLDLVLKENALGADLEEVLAQLVPADNPWWCNQEAEEAEDPASEVAAVGLPWRNRLSSIIDQMSDWTRLANRYLDLGNGGVGTAIGAAAASKTAVGQASANHRSWRQGDLSLTLSIKNAKPFAVTLHIDEGPEIDINYLTWIEEKSFEADPHSRPALRRFEVKRTGKVRTFKVEAKPAEVVQRLSAIKAAEAKTMSDAQVLLPFVEWD